MIAYLHGTILRMEQVACVVRAGDIGYRVFCPEATLFKKTIGDTAEFFIFHAIREGAEDLYGFGSEKELELFEHLTSVSGIGPKTALAILNCASPQDIARAVVRGDANVLKQIQGIGSKTAERIVVELKNKSQMFVAWISASDSADDAAISSDNELVDALIGLGYSAAEARQAVRVLPKDGDSNIESRLKAALKGLGKRV